ncbi:5-oxoprolinase subunit PxpA [soil metagenome]
MGEGCGNDAGLMKYVSSVNIACGFHAGDAETMRRTIELALEHGVAIGAHPSYPDRENFGRSEMELPLDEIRRIMLEQISTLSEICDKAGGRLTHVKPHGALYNQSAREPEIAETIAVAVRSVPGNMVLFGLSGSHSIVEAEKIGLKTASEVFADRTYQTDGSLTPRSKPDALIKDVDRAVMQVLDMIKYGRVRSTEAVMIPIVAETVCIHGDGENAVAFARAINQKLTENGIEIGAVNV